LVTLYLFFGSTSRHLGIHYRYGEPTPGLCVRCRPGDYVLDSGIHGDASLIESYMLL
jgi:hypothetical protein